MFTRFNLRSSATGFLLAIVLLSAGCASPEQKAQTYYERGMKFLSQKEYSKARLEFRNALQLSKNHIGALRGSLEVETHDRNIEATVPILQNIVELDPNDIDAKVKLGKLVIGRNEFDKARDLADAALAIDPRKASALTLKALSLLKLNDHSGARRDARAALEIDPVNAEAIIVLAADRFNAGDLEGALKILERQKDSPNEDVGIQVFKIKIWEARGQIDQVETELRKIIKNHPKEPAFRRTLVQLLSSQKRFDDAERELRVLVTAIPEDAEAGFELLRFIFTIKGAAAVRDELVERIKAGGEAVKYQVALAEFDIAQGKRDAGVQQLQDIIRTARSKHDATAAQIKLAEFHIQDKKLEAAEKLVSEILARDSRNVDGLRLRAVIRMERGQIDLSISDLRQALNEQPRSTPLMLLLASAYERNGAIELADRQYADATRIATNENVGLSYVAFLRRRGSLDRAEDVLEELRWRFKNNIPTLTALAEVRLGRQNWAGAQDVAETVQRIGSTVLASQIQAAALTGQGQFNDSMQVLEQLHASGAAGTQNVTALVQAMLRAKQYDKAIELMQKLLKENQVNSDALVQIGIIELEKNNPTAAVKSFQSAIEKQPKNPAGYRALGDYYFREKNFDAAEKVIRAGLTEQPNAFNLQETLAAILISKGDYEGAIAEYESMLKQQPGSLVVANNLASLLMDHRVEKASLDRAYTLALMLRKSPLPSFKDTLGWAYYLRSDHKNAVPLLEEAAAQLEDRAEVQYHLGMSYLAIGSIEKAQEQFKKALGLRPASQLEAKIRAAQEKAANRG